jgi:hypothetical protein
MPVPHLEMIFRRGEQAWMTRAYSGHLRKSSRRIDRRIQDVILLHAFAHIRDDKLDAVFIEDRFEPIQEGIM